MNELIEVKNPTYVNYKKGSIAVFAIGIFFLLIAVLVFFLSYKPRTKENLIQIDGIIKNIEIIDDYYNIELIDHKSIYKLNTKFISNLEKNILLNEYVVLIVTKKSYEEQKKYAQVYQIKIDSSSLLDLDYIMSSKNKEDIIGISICFGFGVLLLVVFAILFVKYKKCPKNIQEDSNFLIMYPYLNQQIYNYGFKEYTSSLRKKYIKFSVTFCVPLLLCVIGITTFGILEFFIPLIVSFIILITLMIIIVILFKTKYSIKNDKNIYEYVSSYKNYLNSTNYNITNKKILKNPEATEMLNNNNFDYVLKLPFKINGKTLDFLDNSYLDLERMRFYDSTELKESEILEYEVSLVTKFINIVYLPAVIYTMFKIRLEENTFIIVCVLTNKLYQELSRENVFNLDFDKALNDLGKNVKGMKLKRLYVKGPIVQLYNIKKI